MLPLTGWFGLPHESGIILLPTELNWPCTWQHAIFILPRPFDVWRECQIYLSACGKYSINCRIKPIQNTQINHAQVAKCALSVSGLSDLNYCVVLLMGLVYFLNTHCKTFIVCFKASEWFMPNFCHFSLFCLPFGSHSNTTNPVTFI